MNAVIHLLVLVLFVASAFGAAPPTPLTVIDSLTNLLSRTPTRGESVVVLGNASPLDTNIRLARYYTNQPYPVDNVSAFAVGGGEWYLVTIGQAGGGIPWGLVNGATIEPIHLTNNISIAGIVFSTNASGQVVARATNTTTTVRVADYGALGAPNDPINLLSTQDSTFTDSSRATMWTGIGNAEAWIGSPSGDSATYGVLNFPNSTSYGPSPNMFGYARAVGRVNIPPGGALSLRLTAFGHGYTNAIEDVPILETDGVGVDSSFQVRIATNGFLDGWIESGQLRVISKPSGGIQQLRIGHVSHAITNALGGLRAPLVVGNTYHVSLSAEWVSATGASSREWIIGTSTNSSACIIFTPQEVATTHTGTFIADSTGPIYFGLRDTSSAGEQYLLDDIVVTSSEKVADPADEGEIIQLAIDQNPGATIELERNRKYTLTRGLVIRDRQRIEGNGSTLKIAITDGSRQDGLQIESDDVAVKNLRIVYSATAPNNNQEEGSQSIVGIGHFQYWDNPSFNNIVLDGLILEGGGSASQGSSAVMVVGASNVRLENVYVPDNDKITRAFGVYWSGDLVQPAGIINPSNVRIINCQVGRLTGAGSGGVGASVLVSGGSSGLTVQNLLADYMTGNFIYVTPGDLDHQGSRRGNGRLTGILIDGAKAHSVGRYGLRLQTLASYQTGNDPVIADGVPVTLNPTNNTVEWPGLTNMAASGSYVRFSGTLPPELSTATNYWVVWANRGGFRLSPQSTGPIDGNVVDFSSSGSGVTAKMWKGMQHGLGRLVVRGLDIHSESGVYDGVLADGCENLLIEGQTVISGFKHGVSIEPYTQNNFITVRDTEILDSRGAGIMIPGGHDITIENTKVLRSGVDDLSDDERSGIWVQAGSRVRLVGNTIGDVRANETTRAGIKIDNDSLDIEALRVVGNHIARNDGTIGHAIELNSTSTNATPYLWDVMEGNTFERDGVITNLLQYNARYIRIPAARAADGYGQSLDFGNESYADLRVQRLIVGADDDDKNPGRFSRTDASPKISILAAPSYYNAWNPIQWARVEGSASRNALRLGIGISGAENVNISDIYFYTASTNRPGASVQVAGVIDKFGNWAIGPNPTASTDYNSVLQINGGKPIRLPVTGDSFLTNGVGMSSQGYAIFFTNSPGLWMSDGTNFLRVPFQKETQPTNAVLSGLSDAGYGSAGQILSSTGGGVAWSNAPAGGSSGGSPFIHGDTNIQYITNTTAATSVFSVTNAASVLTNDGEALMFFIRGSVLQNSGGSANHSLTITHGGHVMMNGAGITTFATSSSRRPLFIDGEIYRMSATKALMRLRYVIGSNKSGGGYYGDEGAGPTVTREFVSNDNSSLTNATYTLDWSAATNVFKIQLANSVNNMQTEVYVRTIKR